jgi:hypothetical protein
VLILLGDVHACCMFVLMTTGDQPGDQTLILSMLTPVNAMIISAALVCLWLILPVLFFLKILRYNYSNPMLCLTERDVLRVHGHISFWFTPHLF